MSPLKIGASGADQLNRTIHNHLFGDRGLIESTPVVYTKNMRCEIDKHFLVNGLMGNITRVLDTNPRFPRSEYLNVDFDGEPVTLTRSEVENHLEMAHALTVHKSQGSDWTNVIVILPKSTYLVDRSMVYTALSRCREKCIVITDELDWIKRAVKKEPFYKKRQNRLMAGQSTIKSKHLQLGLFEN